MEGDDFGESRTLRLIYELQGSILIDKISCAEIMWREDCREGSLWLQG